MLRFVALFAFVAVAAAEPQWLEHMKTPSGDTVSVAAAKAKHYQLKADEYVKKGYASPVVYANAGVYAPYSGIPVYNQGVYGLHHIGKRDAEAESQYVYNAGVYANGYNGYALPKVYNQVASPVVYKNAYNGVYNPLFNTYASIHHLGKREAEPESQYVYNAGVYANGYNGYALPKVYNQVASPVVYNSGVYANGYNGYAVPKVYNTFAGVHSIGKREADSDSDSQMVYTTAFGGYPWTNTATFGNIYNAGVYGAAYPAMSSYTNGVVSSYPKTYHSGYAGHRVFKREAEPEADSQWVYNNAYTPYAGYTGYNAFSGYTTPYNYGNVWNRAQYMW